MWHTMLPSSAALPSMGPPRARYHHGDLRNALVGAALERIGQGGQAAFSLREAARDVGVSANAAYRHFDDKAALLTAAAAAGFERLSRRMRLAMNRAARRAGGGSVAIARFKAVGRAYVAFALDQPELFRLMFSESGGACTGATPTAPEKPTPWQLVGLALDDLVAEGVLAPAQREGAELKVWSAVHGFAALVLAGGAAMPRGRSRSVALEALLAFTVRGLADGP
jgi:AcrR family transcriptional regulator